METDSDTLMGDFASTQESISQNQGANVSVGQSTQCPSATVEPESSDDSGPVVRKRQKLSSSHVSPASSVRGAPLASVRVPESEQKSLPREQYKFYADSGSSRAIRKILREVSKDGNIAYAVQYKNSKQEVITLDQLEDLPGGSEALTVFQNSQDLTSSADTDSDGSSPILRRAPPRAAKAGPSGLAINYRLNYNPQDSLQDGSEKANERDGDFTPVSDQTFSSKRSRLSTKSDFTPTQVPSEPPAQRRSSRVTKHVGNFQEIGMGDIYRPDSDEDRQKAPRFKEAEEVFIPLDPLGPFQLRHMKYCETCGQSGSNDRPLVPCQGCSLSYHQACLGRSSSRDHLVTKIGEQNFVLQCRRCLNHPKKGGHDPDLGICQHCHEANPACRPFQPKKTPLQKQKDRELNGGDDPVIQVPIDVINNEANILFRCRLCHRGFHFHHLPSRSSIEAKNITDEIRSKYRLRDYGRSWACFECSSLSDKISSIVAWRPIHPDSQNLQLHCKDVNEDAKEYLINWESRSHFHDKWMPGPWVWGIAMPAMLKAFNKREDGPKTTFEDAVPEEWLRVDIVFDVDFKTAAGFREQPSIQPPVEVIREALVKYQGLGYEDAVWEKVPSRNDRERWDDFMTAYNNWYTGQHFQLPDQSQLQFRLNVVRTPKLPSLKNSQPDTLTGGKLMDYQLEGLNWMYSMWHMRKSGILADEMGLGKTIQVIALLARLVEDLSCFPFLIIAPNSTCTNWRREIQKWAPSLRVVTYFGSAMAKEMAAQYELFPNGSTDVRTHIVVASYEAAPDFCSGNANFKRIPWEAIIIDEGQRLKNDGSLLFQDLMRLPVPFKLLLTGTPLQNRARELLNLLHFLDHRINVGAIAKSYDEMTPEKVRELQDMLRPVILRRTKQQVLKFLPPMTQIVVPVGMTKLQHKVYKSIYSQDERLLEAIFNPDIKVERTKWNNIMMQLRKDLCHPFVYSQNIEERTDDTAVSHRNLVDASGKLQLLELLLPKLQARGHRVLFFSQFLDMLLIMEDFLVGMRLPYQRLDGSMSSLQKQKRIDEFNAPNSPLFAFLLSTRAGAVGINLATADTVIILDPDWNPFQDIQALSRSHRIGQKKPVLCLQLITKHGVEAKIAQIGRKKLSLDHTIVQQLGEDDTNSHDVASILRSGAQQIFSQDDDEVCFKYDDASVEELLDRCTDAPTVKTEQPQFDQVRVWEATGGQFQDGLEDQSQDDATAWEAILKDRERRHAEKEKGPEQLGRGRRTKATIDYRHTNAFADIDAENEALPAVDTQPDRAGSDADFQAEESSLDGNDDIDNAPMDAIDDISEDKESQPKGKVISSSQTPRKAPNPLRTPRKPVNLPQSSQNETSPLESPWKRHAPATPLEPEENGTPQPEETTPINSLAKVQPAKNFWYVRCQTCEDRGLYCPRTRHADPWPCENCQEIPGIQPRRRCIRKFQTRFNRIRDQVDHYPDKDSDTWDDWPSGVPAGRQAPVNNAFYSPSAPPPTTAFGSQSNGNQHPTFGQTGIPPTPGVFGSSGSVFARRVGPQPPPMGLPVGGGHPPAGQFYVPYPNQPLWAPPPPREEPMSIAHLALITARRRTAALQAEYNAQSNPFAQPPALQGFGQNHRAAPMPAMQAHAFQPTGVSSSQIGGARSATNGGLPTISGAPGHQAGSTQAPSPRPTEAQQNEQSGAGSGVKFEPEEDVLGL